MVISGHVGPFLIGYWLPDLPHGFQEPGFSQPFLGVPVLAGECVLESGTFHEFLENVGNGRTLPEIRIVDGLAETGVTEKGLSGFFKLKETFGKIPVELPRNGLLEISDCP